MLLLAWLRLVGMYSNRDVQRRKKKSFFWDAGIEVEIDRRRFSNLFSVSSCLVCALRYEVFRKSMFRCKTLTRSHETSHECTNGIR